ncbi:MAG: sugar ABC transporter substrate-binding protein [Chloroflexi bacterium]|nr:sugar ABC transporter substrate-binding protein [Chloroflexota bacterium]
MRLNGRYGITRREMALRTTAPMAAGGILAGCVPGTGSGSGGGEALQKSKAPVTVRVLTRASSDGHTRWFKERTPKVFEPQHPTIEVEFEEVSGMTIAEKLLVLAAGDSVPDVVWLGVVADGGRGGITKGVLRPLDPVMKAGKFDPGVYWKAAREMFSYQGQLYGIPRAGHYGCHVIYVNQELVKRAGIQVPIADANWTTDDLINWAKRTTRAEEGIWGWQPNVAIQECGLHWLRTFGGNLFSEDGKKVLLDAAQAQAGLQWVYDARFKHQTTDNLRANGRQLFQQGKLVFNQATPGLVAEYSAPTQQFVKFDWAATVAPKHASTGTRGTMFGGGALSISKQTKIVAEAWEWIKFITNKENGVLQVAGGAGSPGARDDVWSDPRLAQISPIYGLIQKTFKTPGPTYLPWNETYFELIALVNGKLNDYWDGKAGLRETVQAITSEAASILAKPPA